MPSHHEKLSREQGLYDSAGFIRASGTTIFLVPCTKVSQECLVHKVGDVVQGEHLAPCGEKQFLHVFTANAKPPACNTGNKLKSMLARRLTGHAERAKMLDSGHLVPGCAVVFSQLGLNHNPGVELVGHYEIRKLIPASVNTASMAFSTTLPINSLMESRCPAKGRPRRRSYRRTE